MRHGTETDRNSLAGLHPPKDLLLPSDKIARKALVPWAGSLTSLVGAPGTDVRALSLALNNSALVFSHLGMLRHARWVCLAQIDWVARLASSGDASLTLALQPWINLGRLEAISKNYEIARRRHFELVDHLRERSPLRMDGLTIRPGDWDSMLTDEPSLPVILANVRLIEGVKCWFAAGEFRSASEWLDRIEEETHSTPPGEMHESRLICHIQMGDHERAIALRTVRHDNPYLPLVVHLHLARSMWMRGRTDDAVAYATAVGESLGKTDWAMVDAAVLPGTFRLLEKTVETLRALRCRDLSTRLAESLYRNAVRAGDEVAAHTALRVLCQDAPLPDRKDWLTRKQQIEQASDYPVIRRAAQLPPAETRDEYRALVEAVHQRVGGRTPPDI